MIQFKTSFTTTSTSILYKLGSILQEVLKKQVKVTQPLFSLRKYNFVSVYQLYFMLFVVNKCTFHVYLTCKEYTTSNSYKIVKYYNSITNEKHCAEEKRAKVSASRKSAAL